TQLDGGPNPPVEDELYDLDEDPGERRNVARSHASVVAEMRARLAGELAAVPGSSQQANTSKLPTVHFRFAGGGRAHRVAGTLSAGNDEHPAAIAIEGVLVPHDALRVSGSRLDFAFSTSPNAI